MKFRLRIFKQDDVDDYSLGRRFRFAIVDLDKSTNYPANFVCMLPTQISVNGKAHSVFLQVFGDQSLELARTLLTGALDTEDDPQVKAEIERRLKLLEPESAIQIECSACGEVFQSRRVRRFKQNFCPACMKKRFGSQE